MKPCFSVVRDGQRKMTNDEVYEVLRDARGDRDKVKTEAIMRDSVEPIAQALIVEPTEVTELPEF